VKHTDASAICKRSLEGRDLKRVFWDGGNGGELIQKIGKIILSVVEKNQPEGERKNGWWGVARLLKSQERDRHYNTRGKRRRDAEGGNRALCAVRMEVRVGGDSKGIQARRRREIDWKKKKKGRIKLSACRSQWAARRGGQKMRRRDCSVSSVLMRGAYNGRVGGNGEGTVSWIWGPKPFA